VPAKLPVERPDCPTCGQAPAFSQSGLSAGALTAGSHASASSLAGLAAKTNKGSSARTQPARRWPAY